MGEEGGSGPSPAETLVNSLRALVKEELREPAAPAVPEPAKLPTWGDALWLAVFLTNVALIFYWFPEDAKGPVEFLKVLLPWLLGGAFVVLNNWFRDHLLEWLRLGPVRTVQLAFLVVGLVAGVKTIPIRADVQPPGAVLTVDPEKDPKPKATGERLWLTLQNHTVFLGPGELDTSGQPPRRIELPWWRLPLLAVTGRDWRRVFRVDIDTPQTAKVTIIPQDSDFDFDFLEKVNLQPWRLAEEKISLSKWGIVSSDDSKRAVVFQSAGSQASDPLVLPVGHYWIGMEGCRVEDLELKPIKLNSHKIKPCTKLGNAGS